MEQFTFLSFQGTVAHAAWQIIAPINDSIIFKSIFNSPRENSSVASAKDWLPTLLYKDDRDDQDDRGGLFVESTFEPFLSGPLQIKLTPQYYLGRAFFGGEEGSLINDNVFGLKGSVNVAITPMTQLEGRVEFLTFQDFITTLWSK